MNGQAYFNHKLWGLNFKNTDLHASIGLEGLENFWDTFEKRRGNVKYLRNSMNGYEDKAWFTTERPGCYNAPHGFSITLKHAYWSKFSNLKQQLEIANIHWKRNFGCMATQHDALKYLGHRVGDFPNAEHIGNYGLHLGVHQFLSDDDLDRMVYTLQTFFEGIK
jgi:dTDP-4-amino-4,6-dideoxygalactose transaminase